jgi:chorismate mutase
MDQRKIEECREEIDALDEQLLCLLNRRAEIARQLGALKQGAGLPVCDQTREALILTRLLDTNPGPLENESVMDIFRLIISESRRLQSMQGKKPRLKNKHNESEGVQGNDHQYA